MRSLCTHIFAFALGVGAGLMALNQYQPGNRQEIDVQNSGEGRSKSFAYTKNGFREKVKSITPIWTTSFYEITMKDHTTRWNGVNASGGIDAKTGVAIYYVKDFLEAFGEPAKRQSFKHTVVWYWECSDGTVEVIFLPFSTDGERATLVAIDEH